MRFLGWLCASCFMSAVMPLALMLVFTLGDHPAYAIRPLLFIWGGGAGWLIIAASIPAAALWLGVAFWAARHAGRNGLAAAGAAAGLLHSAFTYWATRSTADAARHTLTNGDLWSGGTYMAGASTLSQVLQVGLAAMLAGAVSGLVFSYFRRNPAKLVIDPGGQAAL
jgi:hypothetical protein